MDITKKHFGKKKIFIIIFYLFIFIVLISQETRKINCDNIIFTHIVELNTVLDSYIDKPKYYPRGPRESVRDEIILIDFMIFDSIDIFRVSGSIMPWELFYKKPECFFHYRNNLVYLFTENYINCKDTIWLNKVFTETLVFLGIQGNAIIDWSKDSIIEFPNFNIWRTFDPFIIEYKLYNGDIIEEKFYNEMLYPKTGKPKSVFFSEFEDIIIIKPDKRQLLLEKRRY